jgi:hypothetical protein
MREFLFVSVLVSVGIGCGGSHNGSPGDAGVDALVDAGPPVETMDIPLAFNRDVDLLFMVDNSPSMADKQANLAKNFAKFVDVLNTVQGGLPNLHVGVVTSDLGTTAADGQTGNAIGTAGSGGCAGKGQAGNLQVFRAPISGALYLSDIAQPDGTRVRNYTGTLADAFAVMSQAGAAGCGFEQSLEAVKRALVPTNAVNTGFLRDGALLAVVLVTDEDDCSISHTALLDPATTGPLGALQSFRCTRFGITCKVNGATPDDMNKVGAKDKCAPTTDQRYLTSVADYAAFLHGLKADPSKVVVAAITGTTAPFAVELRAPSATLPVIPALAHSCTYNGADGLPETADPPVRIKALLDQFPNRSDFESICQQDLSTPLINIAAQIRSAIGDPCVEAHLADVDATTPGFQPGCQVSVKLASGTTNPLALCTPQDATATNPPCWHFVEDAVQCAVSPDHLRLVVEGQAKLAADAHILARCQIAVAP